MQHAHQKGVIHRDLKPGNILVDESGSPKVLDFGIARATDADVQMTTLRTDFRQLMGTISYMSPEQIRGDPGDLDTRSDVYALGVIGHELLTGRLPHDIRNKTIPEAVRVISDEDAAPLSSVDRVFRGDVETIVSKALEKDKALRYPSASDLAADIRRYLQNEPITARPASSMYQLRKFARRNTRLVAALVALFVVLVGATIFSAWLATRARSAERLAADRLDTSVKNEALALAVNDFLNTDLLSAVDPDRLGKDATVRQVVDLASESIGDRFDGQPLLEAAIRETLGKTYSKLGEFKTAEGHFEAVVELRRPVMEPSAFGVTSAMNNLAGAYRKQGRFDEAERLWDEAVRLIRTVSDDDDPHLLATLDNMAGLYKSKGDYKKAISMLEDVVLRQGSVLGPEHPFQLNSKVHLASIYRITGRMDEAERLYSEALEAQRRVLGDDHPDTLGTANHLGLLLKQQRRFEDAEPLLADTLGRQRRVLGETHEDTLATMNNLAILYDDRGQYEDAEPLLTQVVEALRRTRGAEHPTTLSAMNNLAASYREQKRYAEAEPLFLQALEAQRRVLGEEHPQTLLSMGNLAGLYVRQERFEEAEPLGLACHAGLAAKFGPDHGYAKVAASILAGLYDAWGKPEKAAAWRGTD